MIGAVKNGPLRAKAIFARKNLFWKIFKNQGDLDYFQTPKSEKKKSIFRTAVHRTTFRETASFKIGI